MREQASGQCIGAFARNEPPIQKQEAMGTLRKTEELWERGSTGNLGTTIIGGQEIKIEPNEWTRSRDLCLLAYQDSPENGENRKVDWTAGQKPGKISAPEYGNIFRGV